MKSVAPVLLATALVVSHPALAGGSSSGDALDLQTNLVLKAEEALSEAQYAEAVKLAKEATGAFGKTVEGRSDPDSLSLLRARALRVAAFASIRTDGKVAGVAAPAPKNSKVDPPAANIAWAVEQLRVLGKREPGNPYLQARLAEGLAKKAETAAEALETLKKLAADDMMPDAAAWLLLAQLHANAGNTGERDRALEQCRARAHDPAMCVVKGPGETGG